MMQFRALALSVAIAIVCPLFAQQGNGAQAFEKIQSLAGSWQGTFEWSGARSGKGIMNAAYYMTGNGSAVVENLLVDGEPVMTSVYHLDGSDLRLTHFCGAKNQPRLKAWRVDLAHNDMDFAFVDATKLRSPDAPHVHGLEWRMADKDHLTLTFLFTAGGKESRELIRLQRSSK